MLSFLIAIIIDVIIIFLSLRGSMIETHKRSNMSSFLFLRATVGFIQCLNSCVYSGYLISYLVLDHLRKETASSQSCDKYFSGIGNRGFYILLIMSQFIDFSGLICCCFLFSIPRYSSQLSAPNMLRGESNGSSDIGYISFTENCGAESVYTVAETDLTALAPRLSQYSHNQATNQWARCCQRMMRSLQIFSCNIFGGTHVSQNESAFEVRLELNTGIYLYVSTCGVFGSIAPCTEHF